MAQGRALLMAAMIAVVLALPLGVSAYDSGGIEASESQVAMIPSWTECWRFSHILSYFDEHSTRRSKQCRICILQKPIQHCEQVCGKCNRYTRDSSETVEATWDGLLESDDKIWITFEYPRNSGNEVSFFVEFDVTGLPNLRVIQTELTPSSMIHAGDTVEISSLVKNTGSQPAGVTQLEVNLPGILQTSILKQNHLMLAKKHGSIPHLLLLKQAPILFMLLRILMMTFWRHLNKVNQNQ